MPLCSTFSPRKKKMKGCLPLLMINSHYYTLLVGCNVCSGSYDKCQTPSVSKLPFLSPGSLVRLGTDVKQHPVGWHAQGSHPMTGPSCFHPTPCKTCYIPNSYNFQWEIISFLVSGCLPWIEFSKFM